MFHWRSLCQNSFELSVYCLQMYSSDFIVLLMRGVAEIYVTIWKGVEFTKDAYQIMLRQLASGGMNTSVGIDVRLNYAYGHELSIIVSKHIKHAQDMHAYDNSMQRMTHFSAAHAQCFMSPSPFSGQGYQKTFSRTTSWQGGVRPPISSTKGGLDFS